MTIEAIIEQEPRIYSVLKDCEANKAGGLWWKNMLYSVAKERLGRLVGYHAENPILRTERIYETALRAVCDALDY